MRELTRWLLAVVIAAGAIGVARGAAGRSQDLGRVRWSGDLPAALAEARRSGRPVMVLDRGSPQIPATRQFGFGPLSHPIVADAAGEFIAVALPCDGRPEPRLRFLDAQGHDLTPADRPSALTTAGVLSAMAESLRAVGRPVPPYLELAAAEYAAPRRQTATFAVTCYWKGEAGLGHLDGVLGTRTGMLNGDEVVEVDFDPAALDYRTLATKATGMACFRKAYVQGDDQRALVSTMTGRVAARKSEPLDASNQQQFQLSLEPAYHLLPLTALQATKLNAALAAGEPPERFLSPSQLRLHEKLNRIVRSGDKLALYGLEQSFKPDRSPEGLPRYAAEVEERLARFP
jgi:hypothetical protein